MSKETDAGLVDQLVKWAGPLGIVGGGGALAVAYLTHPPSASPAIVASTMWKWIHVGFMVSLICGIFLLFALLVQYFRSSGNIRGTVGFAMAVISLFFVFGLDYAEVFIFPTLAVEFPEVVAKYGDGTSMPSVAFAFPLAGVLFMVGFVLFGWELLKTQTVSASAAWLTIVGTVVFGIGLSGMLPMIVVKIGSVLFGGGLFLLGINLWGTTVPSVER